LVTGSNSTLATCRNHFSQVLNVHRINNVKRTEKLAVEPLVPQSSAFEFGIAIEKPKRHKSSGIAQIPSELITARGITIRSQIHKLINSIWNKEELSVERKVSISVPIYKKADIIDCSNYRGTSLLSTTYKFLFNIQL